MTPFTGGSLLYFPLLAWWTFAYLHNPAFAQWLYIAFALSFILQIWTMAGKSPEWAGRISLMLQLLCLLPVLLYADHPDFSLFFALLPAFSLSRIYGSAWGMLTLFAATVSAVSGSIPGNRFFGEWPFYAASIVFSWILFFSILPMVEMVEKASRQFSVVEGLGKLFDGITDRHAVLQWLVEKAVQLVGTEFGAVYLWNEKLGKLELQASFGKVLENVKENLLELAGGTLEWVVKEGKIYIANDLSLDPRYANYSSRTSVQSLACTPIGRGGLPNGTFVCGSTLSRPFSQREIDLLNLFTRYISLVMEQEDWSKTHVRLLQELEALHACCAALTSSLGLEEILHLLAGFAMQVMEAKEWTLFLFDPGKNEFFGFLSTTAFMEEIHDLRLGWGEGAISQAALRKEPVMIPDLSKNPLVSEKENRNGRFLSMLILPLIKQETVLGAIQVSDTTPRVFSDEEIRFATSLASLAAIVLGRSSLLQQGVVRMEDMPIPPSD